MTRRYPLHRRTRQILASIEKEFGAPVPVIDCFEYIADIDEKVRRCFEPAEVERIEILDQPVRCGKMDFYALSMLAEEWYEEFCRCFPDAPKMQEAGYLYASAHSMNSDVLKKAWPDKQKLAIEVFSWRSECGVKPGQVAALRSAINPPIPWPDAERDDESMDCRGYGGTGWMVSELCKLKQDPEFWRTGCPMLRAVQEYRNCTMYSDGDPKLRNARWDRWQTAACVDEQKAINRLRGWLMERKANSAAPKAEGPAIPQVPPASEAVRSPETERGEKSATESGGASFSGMDDGPAPSPAAPGAESRPVAPLEVPDAPQAILEPA